MNTTEAPLEVCGLESSQTGCSGSGWRPSSGKEQTLLAGTNSEQRKNVRNQERSHQSGEEAQSTKRVLVVDDHSLFRQVLAVVLKEQTNLDNLQADSLAAARRVLAEHNGSELALAVVDLELPGEGSGELIGDLHRIGTPVLAIAKRRNSKRPGQHSVADKVFMTDASKDDILDAVRDLIDG